MTFHFIKISYDRRATGRHQNIAAEHGAYLFIIPFRKHQQHHSISDLTRRRHPGNGCKHIHEWDPTKKKQLVWQRRAHGNISTARWVLIFSSAVDREWCANDVGAFLFSRLCVWGYAPVQIRSWDVNVRWLKSWDPHLPRADNVLVLCWRSVLIYTEPSSDGRLIIRFFCSVGFGQKETTCGFKRREKKNK